MHTFRVALAQINTTVGDLDGNAAKAVESIEQAKAVGADLVAFPELTTTGYPPEDLLFKQQFLRANLAALDRIVEATRGITAVIGFVDADEDIYNAAAIAHDGVVAGVYRKMYLPNYSVFDEERYFRAGNEAPVYVIGGREGGARVGVNVCEDIWRPVGPTVLQAEAGAQVIVNINGSPFNAGKAEYRDKLLATRATDQGVFVCYVNLVGGQDELVFDGGSMVFDPSGKLLARAERFDEALLLADLDIDLVLRNRLHNPLPRKQRATRVLPGVETPRVEVSSREDRQGADGGLRREPIEATVAAPLSEPEEVYRALVVGTRDYVIKNGFERVLVGLSGGVDSALVAAVAADALGGGKVVGVAMPSRYNASESEEDARALAQNLGIDYHVISIEPVFEAMLSTLGGMFEGTQPNVAEENVQARIRGNILMAISNKFGWLVLTTGNKSEMSMGYATLYGDMAGGFAVIKDVPKVLVYDLCRHRNKAAGKDLIPARILEKPPSAELRPDQKDEDSLPPYELLDPILEAYVEKDRTFDDLIGMGLDAETVKQVIRGVDRNEYKRRQAPPGVKITSRAFGRDRRLPIVNKFKPF